MDITILVKSSSSSDPRSVDVVEDDSGISIYCDCPAGVRERVCKHKRAIASADASMLFDDAQLENFNKVVERLAQSGYPDLMKELAAAENELEPVKEKVIDIKKKIARAMKTGLK